MNNYSKQKMSHSNLKDFTGSCQGGDEIPSGTFHGGDQIPAGTFH